MKIILINIGMVLSIILIFTSEGLSILLSTILSIVLFILREKLIGEIEEKKWAEELKHSESEINDIEWSEFYEKEDLY